PDHRPRRVHHQGPAGADGRPHPDPGAARRGQPGDPHHHRLRAHAGDRGPGAAGDLRHPGRERAAERGAGAAGRAVHRRAQRQGGPGDRPRGQHDPRPAAAAARAAGHPPAARPRLAPARGDHHHQRRRQRPRAGALRDRAGAQPERGADGRAAALPAEPAAP
ncbi:unnamed protein product, partial [Heterosigma akashiwo]